MTRTLEVVVDGLAFAEGPRWHDGELWFSDMHDHRVCVVDGNKARTVVEVPTQPSGLGWRPDGRLLVVSMTDRRLLRLDADGTLNEVADLGAFATWHINDMVVDAVGRAYIGNFGSDIYTGQPPVAAVLVAVEPEGVVRAVANDLLFPNGTVITPDGKTLIVGESYGARLTAFDIEADGSLSGRRVFAQLDGAVPDGICLDAEGAIWLASPISHEVVRVRDGGEVLERINVGERQAYACMLGGDQRTTLFVCTAFDSEPEKCREQRAGRIEAVEVEVPGAGLP